MTTMFRITTAPIIPVATLFLCVLLTVTALDKAQVIKKLGEALHQKGVDLTDASALAFDLGATKPSNTGPAEDSWQLKKRSYERLGEFATSGPEKDCAISLLFGYLKTRSASAKPVNTLEGTRYQLVLPKFTGGVDQELAKVNTDKC